MTFKSATALAGVLLAASGLSALARPGVTSTDSNLRSGPGVESPVVSVLPAGTPIDVGRCAGSWCRVRAEGGAGYLSRSLIAFGGAPGRAIGRVDGGATAYPGDDYANNGYGYDNSSYGYDNYGYGYGDGYDYGPDVGIGLGFYDGGGRGYRRGENGGQYAGERGVRVRHGGNGGQLAERRGVRGGAPAGGGAGRGPVAADSGSFDRGGPARTSKPAAVGGGAPAGGGADRGPVAADPGSFDRGGAGRTSKPAAAGGGFHGGGGHGGRRPGGGEVR